MRPIVKEDVERSLAQVLEKLQADELDAVSIAATTNDGDSFNTFVVDTKPVALIGAMAIGLFRALFTIVVGQQRVKPVASGQMPH